MHKPIHYKPNRGGRAPDYLRNAFIDWVGLSDLSIDTCEYDGEEGIPIDAILGWLWNCTDIMPAYACRALELRQRSTYAQGVREAKRVRIE